MVLACLFAGTNKAQEPHFACPLLTSVDMPLLLGKHKNKPLPALGNEIATLWWDEGHHLLIEFVHMNPGILTLSFV